MRAAPDDAIERLGIWLNLQPGEDIPFNRLSRQTGLAWATVVKYTQLIERVAPTLPHVKVGRHGVRVTRQPDAVAETLNDDMTKAAVVMLMHERQQTSPVEAPPAFLAKGITQLQLLDFVQDGKLTAEGKTLAYGALDAFQRRVHGNVPVPPPSPTPKMWRSGFAQPDVMSVGGAAA